MVQIYAMVSPATESNLVKVSTLSQKEPYPESQASLIIIIHQSKDLLNHNMPS